MKTVSKPSTFLFAFSGFLTFSIFVLIIAGGLVTSKEAGLAVPDWPLSYGQAFPPMVGNIFWEHGHRMIAGFVGILTFIFTVCIHRLENRSWVKNLSRWMAGSVLLQALLGGLTVLLLLPDPISICHAALGQSFFCLAIAMTYFQSLFFKSRCTRGAFFSDGLKKLTLTTTLIIFTQLLLGSAVRHSEPTLFVVLHIAVAMIALIYVMLTMSCIYKEAHSNQNGLLKLAVGFGVATTFQIFLGMGAFILKRVLERQTYAPGNLEVFFASAHQSLGAIVLGLSLLLTLRVRS